MGGGYVWGITNKETTYIKGVENMNTLYISNDNRYIHVDIGNIHIKYLGPCGLKRFNRINKFEAGVIYVETEFNDCTEEEFIDVTDILSDYDYDIPEVLKSIESVEIRNNH